MYKAKIELLRPEGYFEISIPCLGLNRVPAYAIGPKTVSKEYSIGDLVIASRLNDNSWVILGYVYSQSNN